MREKPCKNLVEKRQKKSSVEPCQVGEREESLKKIWKSVLNQSKHCFKKNLIHNVRLIEKQVRLIEPGRGSLKFLKRIPIDWKPDWINRNSRKTAFRKITWFFKTYLKALNVINKNAWVLDEMLFQNTSFKPNFSKI